MAVFSLNERLRQQWGDWWQPIMDPQGYVTRAAEKTTFEWPLSTDPEPWLQRWQGRLQYSPQWRKLTQRAGAQSTPAQGESGLFRQLREYAPGDDCRKIDWAVLARTQQAYVREFEAEEQQTLWLVVDWTPSMMFGKVQTKARLALDLMVLLTVMAEQSGLKMGVVWARGYDQSHVFPAGAGRQHSRLLVHQGLQVLSHAESHYVKKPSPQKYLAHHVAGLAEGLDRCRYHARSGARVAVLSDFLEPSDWPKQLNRLGQRTRVFSRQNRYGQEASVISVRIEDPVETPDGYFSAFNGFCPWFEDPETGEQVWGSLDKTWFSRRIALWRNNRDQQLLKLGYSLWTTDEEQTLLETALRVWS